MNTQTMVTGALPAARNTRARMMMSEREASDRLDSIRSWCDTLVQRAGIFERDGDNAALAYLQKRLYHLWLEVDPTYSIGINGPPPTGMGSTAMSEKDEVSDAE